MRPRSGGGRGGGGRGGGGCDFCRRLVTILLFSLAAATRTAKRQAYAAIAAATDVSTNQKHNPSAAEIYQSSNFCTNDAQCLNGGTCTAAAGATSSSSNSRRCYCPSGYGGSHCQDHCPLKCQNGGYCQLLDQRYPGQYASDLDRQGGSSGAAGSHSTTTTSSSRRREAPYGCKCRGLFAGKLCEVPYTNCPENGNNGSGRRCYNGGSCPTTAAAATETTANLTTMILPCECPEGFYGDGCEERGVGTTAAGGDNSEMTAKPDAKPSRAAVVALVVVVFVVVVVVLLAIFIKRRRRRKRHCDSTSDSCTMVSTLWGLCNRTALQIVRPTSRSSGGGGRSTKGLMMNLRPHHPEYWEAEEMPGGLNDDCHPHHHQQLRSCRDYDPQSGDGQEDHNEGEYALRFFFDADAAANDDEEQSNDAMFAVRGGDHA